MVLGDYLFPQENIEYQSEFPIKFGNDYYELYLTDKRLIGYLKTGFLFKKDKIFATPIEEINDIMYHEHGRINKKATLIIETDTKKMPFEGKPEDIKIIWQEMQKFLKTNVQKSTQVVTPSHQDITYSSENEFPKEVNEVIKVLKNRLARGEIDEDEFFKLKRLVIEN